MARLRECLSLLLALLLLPDASFAKFYIGRYKTVPAVVSDDGGSGGGDDGGGDGDGGQARSMPYIIYPGEAGSESLAFSPNTHQRWRVEQPPIRRHGNIEPAGAFGLTNNYGNDPYKGYSLVHKKEFKYVIPPFTPGGRVHVAFQFWIPISLGGFFVSGRELEAALRSANPTSYITKLFLKHLSANTTAGELLGHLKAPVVEAAIDRFLKWVIPHLHHFTGNSINTVNTYTLRVDKKGKHKTGKSKRSLLDRLSHRRKRRDTSLRLEPKEEAEEGKSTVKRSFGRDSDCLTLSPKCPDEIESSTKHSGSTNTKTRRRRLAYERSLDEPMDFAEDEREEVEKARHTTSKSRRKSQAEERKLYEPTDFAEDEREVVQVASHTRSNSPRKRQAEEGSLDEESDSAKGHTEEEPHVGLRRHKRQVRGDSDGWVTIGGGRGSGGSGSNDHSTNIPTSPLLTRPSAWSSHRPRPVIPNDRLLWDDDHHVITHNDLSMEEHKRPSLDFTSPIERPRPSPPPSSSSFPSWPSFLTRPASRPPPSSFNPSHASNSQPSDTRPSFPAPPRPSSSSSASTPSPVKPHNPFSTLASSDNLPSGATPNPKVLDVRSRLSRLDYLFTNLHLKHEDCRRRILCEVSREPDTFAPLSDMVHGETRLPGNPLDVSRELLNSAEGARLLSYVEAVKVGEDRTQVCDIYRYRCRVEARQVINTEILPIWREVVRWLTVKVLTQDSSKLALASG
ncbi:uncharacterized protein LOC126999717 [Eriocheir sinensis]|uniref:uncharacterized protein LOC126999717 n=1 Tax=Eriocheir sinensis TaxID=95602 RepID=UPI0021C80EDD|nr:uncharacterized protein LOC126999717 [Eriocheir sinensis]XP_050718440.1 uncharacterized protein LOC126999717 [Eriocheir sinensis]XP_050718441.1 uncharacterized protein LOC126999717 [Eriocheir sinensis]XP_050718442.1 uncharacterized protein LOC126999717 [Eriocheir sinensis]XP_050718443.1 uncharacterized protein LOC126999717 [Eriocheir sinensis]XP_050718444.1 uncharacterized protein LOC126999717 [Eriocheir sinensis]